MTARERRAKSLQDQLVSYENQYKDQQDEKVDHVGPDDERKMVIKALDALSLSPSPVKTPGRQEIAKVVFVYHSRVLRWFQPPGSEYDPFICDPSYRSEKNPQKIVWNRVKHSFASAVDSFVGYGVENTDKKELNRLRLTKQIQLIGEIALEHAGRQESRRGVFGYSVNLSGKCIHRCFTRVESERIQSEYMDKGWLQLDDFETQSEGMSRAFDIAHSVVQTDDGSRVIRETKNLVVIADPKNNATITLVKIS